jgi:hypothetical protein
MYQKIGTTLYLGIKRDILIDPKQRRNFRYSNREGFIVSPEIGRDFSRVKEEIDAFCKEQIKRYIDRGIAKLRSKKITIQIPFTDGTRSFDKEVSMSIDDYLDATGFSRNIDYEIGSYEREWGINAINVTKKIFTLYFNLNLIKYDDGPHIEHVVAHELAHIFFRDHGPKFQDALRQLDSSTGWSQSFFSGGISQVGQTNNSYIYLVIILALISIIYFILQFFSTIGDFFAPSSQF